MSGHRPRRESASNEKEFAEIRRENRRLKRQIAKLQTLVSKRLDPAHEVPSEEPVLSLENNLDCPTCKTPVRVLDLGFKILKVCKACGWKKAE